MFLTNQNAEIVACILLFNKFHMLLFHMLHTFWPGQVFFPMYYFNNLYFKLPPNITWTDEYNAHD